MMQDSPRMTAKGALYKLLWILVAGFGVFLLLPHRPLEVVPSNLDGSWRIALQIAYDRQLVFGRDFIFTYGPLGFLSARSYATSTRSLVLAYDIFVALQLILISIAIFRRSSSLITLLNYFGILFVLSSAVYFLDPPIVLFVLSTFWLFDGRENRSWLRFILALLNAMLSFYVKVNLGVAAVGQLLLVSLIDLLRAESRKSAACRLAFTLAALGSSMLLINVAVIDYLVASLHIANGFNDAMYLELDKIDYLTWSLGVLALLAFVHVVTLFKRQVPILVLSSTGFAFLLFKQGFVRADDHIYVFFDYIVCCFALLALFTSGRIKALNSLVLAIVICISACQNNMPYLDLPIKRMQDKFALLEKYQASFEQTPQLKSPAASFSPEIAAAVGEQAGTPSIDLMPDDTSALYYSGLNYLPRPVIQSYSSYDHYLDQINAAYLLERGPTAMLFTHGCVDGRYCLHDETEAKLALLRQYDYHMSDNRFVLLKRRESPRGERRTLIKSGRMRLGERLEIEQDGTLKVAVFDISYSHIGKLRRFSYKPFPLKVTVAGESGKKTFRAIVPILNGGVIASFAIDDQQPLPSLFKHEFSSLPAVKFLRLHSDHSSHYTKFFDYRVYRIEYQ